LADIAAAVMIFNASFTVTIDTVDPIGYAKDSVGNALLQVRDVYEGKCFQGKFIHSILGICRTSRCRINRVGCEVGSGTVEVKFRALCSRYHPGDAVAGMQVVCGQPLTGDAVGPRSAVEPAVLTIINPNATFAVGQVLPVRIIRVSYDPLSDKPSAATELLTCRLEETIWEVAAPQQALTEEVIAKIYQQVAEAIEDRQAIQKTKGDQQVRVLFAGLLATYQGQKEKPLPPTLKPFELETFAAFMAWVKKLKPETRWTRSLTKPFDWVGVCEATDKFESEQYRVVRAGADEIISAVLCAVLNSVQVLNDFPRVFPSDRVIQSHMNVWMLMRKAQLR
jgi:hypothetical protein